MTLTTDFYVLATTEGKYAVTLGDGSRLSADVFDSSTEAAAEAFKGLQENPTDWGLVLEAAGVFKYTRKKPEGFAVCRIELGKISRFVTVSLRPPEAVEGPFIDFDSAFYAGLSKTGLRMRDVKSEPSEDRRTTIFRRKEVKQ